VTLDRTGNVAIVQLRTGFMSALDVVLTKYAIAAFNAAQIHGLCTISLQCLFAARA